MSNLDARPWILLIVFLTALAAAVLLIMSPAAARTVCKDEMICTGVKGCRWETICRETVVDGIIQPTPAGPTQCKDEMICTGIKGCRWETICK